MTNEAEKTFSGSIGLETEIFTRGHSTKNASTVALPETIVQIVVPRFAGALGGRVGTFIPGFGGFGGFGFLRFGALRDISVNHLKNRGGDN